MSIHILVVFLFLAFSCKSEVKPTTEIAEGSVATTPIETTKSSDTNADVKIIEPTKVNEVDEKENAKLPVKEKTNKIKAVENSENKAEVNEEIPVKETKEVIIETKQEVKESISEETNNEDTKNSEEAEVAKEDVEIEKPSKPEKIETFIGIPKHSLLDDLLKAHVSASGVVDYAALKSKEAALDSYLNILESNAPGTTWNRNQELAYWINAYNAYTLKLILKNYPLNSITDLHGGKPWDVKWIKLDGKTLSLNNIENDIIRPKYKEPRIHFAVNCAAKSCPPLLNGAYKSRSLDAQLESQTKKFINNSAYNTLAKSEIKVSKIFEWYGVDFGDVASFVLRYADTTVKPSAKVSFMDYDWRLNGK